MTYWLFINYTMPVIYDILEVKCDPRYVKNALRKAAKKYASITLMLSDVIVVCPGKVAIGKTDQYRSRETRINWLFQFAPEKLGRFENLGKNHSAF